MSDTPRTDAEWELQCGSVQSWYRSAEGMKEFARQLERELVAVTEERDRLKEIYRVHHDEAERITKQIDEYRGLLIELYNDINVIHSGKAVAKLSRMFRDENYN